MRPLLITFFLVVNTQYAALQKKCCDADSYLKKINSNYICDKDEDKRVQIFTKHTNYLNANNATGEDYCVDGNQIISNYTISSHTVIAEEPIDVNFFTKCCPLNSYYNSVTHACVWANTTSDGFITQNFVKVGLPHCKIVVDYKLDSGKNYSLESDTLHIDNSSFPGGQFCLDKDENGLLIARGCYKDLNVCNYTRCIRKCCADGKSFVNGNNCVDTYTHGLNLTFSNRINNTQDPFAVIHNYSCKRIYVLQSKIIYYLDTDGVFWAYHNNTLSFERYGVDRASYCIEHVYGRGKRGHFSNGFKFFMCFPETIKAKFLATKWVKIVSCIAIILTMATYLIVPELLNLFGKILLSYCSATLTAFIIMSYLQFEINVHDKECIVTSFLIIYTTLCSFTWLNVMCFDIWWTFGTPKSLVTAKQRKSELKRFLLYSLYGWGIPAILTLIIFLAYLAPKTPKAIRPILGTYKCFLELRPENYAVFLYYATPLILIEIVNLVLFTKTLRYCLKVKGEINKMNENRISVKEKKNSFNADREQLFLTLKLGVTMGVSFAFEVVSSLYDFNSNPVMKYVEIVWDTFNCCQGVFIFLIFICKVKIFRLCRQKLLGSKVKKISLSSGPTITTHVCTPLTYKIRNE